VWEGTYEDRFTAFDVRVIELDPDDLLVQQQLGADGLWETATDDEVVAYALHAALVHVWKSNKP
jgi:serine/threonine protein phosphatase PrpC